MSKQTAVEWLINELEEQKLIKIDKMSTILFKKNFATRYELIVHQAKEMEREQIIEAFYQCGKDNFEHIKVINRSAKEYYNETYGR